MARSVERPWALEVERRLSSIEARLGNVESMLARLEEVMERQLGSLEILAETQRRTLMLENRVHHMETRSIQDLNRRLDRIYAGIAIVAFLVTVLSSLIVVLF